METTVAEVPGFPGTLSSAVQILLFCEHLELDEGKSMHRLIQNHRMV